MTENQSGLNSYVPNTYDVIPYEGTHALTHPFRLETIAVLLGMAPPPVANCRVLELGSATGSNLIPQAASLPGATFVGMDLSQRQVEEGRRVIESVGLENIELRQADILDVDASWGQFDYIICHGVYSWVPAPVRDKILEICKRHLVPNGIALVSYNVFPGWHLKRMIRDVVLYHTSQFEDPKEQIAGAKKILRFMVDMHSKESIFGQILRQTLGDELDLLTADKDFYLFHEFIETVNEPCLFYEFMEAAGSQGLQYVWDANVLHATAVNLPLKTRQALENAPLIRKEQYKDFLLNRAFRSTLLCHEDVALERNIGNSKACQFQIALARDGGPLPLDIRNDDVDTIPLRHGTLSIKDRLAKAAIVYLKEIFPRFAPFDDLLKTAAARVAACGTKNSGALERAADRVAAMVLTGYASALCELCVTPPQWCLTVSERPRASALARFHAREGKIVVNPLHLQVNLKPPNRYLLQHLDGTHDRQELIEITRDAVRAGTLSVKGKPRNVRELDPKLAAQFVSSALEGLARAGLLVE